MHKPIQGTAVSAMLLLATYQAHAAVINGMNWADRVVAHSANIQNFGGTLMTPATHFWLTGPPDADGDGNGYARDPGDPDYVAGWRANAPGEFIVMEWLVGIPDLPGDDLVVRCYRGPQASARVLASVDGVNYSLLGTIGGGTPGYLTDAWFDFAARFSARVHYVRVERALSGPNSGMFFDAFGGVLPEPATMIPLLFAAAAVLLHDGRRAG